MLDELPAVSLMGEDKTIDRFRYPNFAALAKEATWYRNATAVAGISTYSLPSILTGNYPEATRRPVLEHYPRNLFTLLGNRYRLEVMESATQMCPAGPENRQIRDHFLSRQTSLLADTALVYLPIVMPDKISNRLPSVNNT